MEIDDHSKPLISILAFCALFFFTHSASSDIGEWINDPPEGANYLSGLEWIEEARFCEVTVSSLEFAEEKLHEKDFLPISETILNAKLGGQCKAKSGFHPYLVRAVYSGSNGLFRVGVIGDRLWVIYDALGHMQKYKRSALIVFLKDEPKGLYVSVHLTM